MKIEIGLKIGCLTVLEKAEDIGDQKAWLCLCECGNQKAIKNRELAYGKAITCGCKINTFPNKDPKLSSAMKIYTNKYKDGNLTFEQFVELSQQNCFYCGIEPSTATNRLDAKCRNDRRKRENQFAGERGTFVYNGLDRVDSGQKHNLENVVPCCATCNKAKLAMTADQFHDWVKRIYEHWIIKKGSRKP